MSWTQQLEKVAPGHFVLPKTKTMRVEAHLFLSDKLLWGEGPESPGLEEAVFNQVVNAASFPGVTRVAVTPDCHVGYGVPIGTVVETEGVLLPTAAGYDIGCGMVQLQTTLTAEDVADPAKRRQWIDEVTRRIAVGVGASRVQKQRRIDARTFAEVVRHGAQALGRHASATERDFLPVEDDRVDIPTRAYDKRDQLGSLGGGNHFTEMQVDESGRVWVMLHTGSRGFGWNIAKHFFVEGAAALGLGKHSEDFIWLDASSRLGKDYWNLHNMAANFAVANRLLIGEAVCGALEDVFGGTASIYYEISHNLIQKESGRFVARKGATRAFPGGHPALTGTPWAKSGHPILIPGSMETGSAILFAEKGASQSIYSVNHGAGRRLSRGEARRVLDQDETDLRMMEADILLNTRTTPLDESGPCYKNLDDVLNTVEMAGLATVARRLKPVACIKGAD
ncbi:Protein RtcB [Cystobacter fuscus DSM 2262]|uniref:tRNA-splicing ligase RtcB n=1 Tax=Cystobacter fuscus (strain ATCC 25194 / DSM 2262 / NBRC 100088 / M29) TaxID=1242864 RepID=S9QSE4_CYSF2|nr:RtcB family protein [Cystobacter fuscus]EPX64194.1 Protein RtcB [Cystobacter fuscus DSM 2262]